MEANTQLISRKIRNLAFIGLVTVLVDVFWFSSFAKQLIEQVSHLRGFNPGSLVYYIPYFARLFFYALAWISVLGAMLFGIVKRNLKLSEKTWLMLVAILMVSTLKLVSFFTL